VNYGEKLCAFSVALEEFSKKIIGIICKILPCWKLFIDLLNFRSDTGCHVFCYALLVFALCYASAKAAPALDLWLHLITHG